MANPQCENGYIRFASELWEALCRIRIPGEARQIFDFIARKTYGYNKKEDAISLSQFVLGTGIKKPDVCHVLKKLKEMNLVCQKANDIANIYSINKDFQSWKPLGKKQTLGKKQIVVGEKANEALGKKQPTIDNIQKTITKDNTVVLTFDAIWKKYPKRIGKKAAERHYKASVKTEQDYFDILQAAENYLKSETVKKGFVQNGSTWFNNWRDWIDYEDIKVNEKPKLACASCNMIFDERETTYVHDGKKICGKCDMKLTRERLRRKEN